MNVVEWNQMYIDFKWQFFQMLGIVSDISECIFIRPTFVDCSNFSLKYSLEIQGLSNVFNDVTNIVI